MGGRGFRGGRPPRARGGFTRSDPEAARIQSQVQIFVEGLPKDVKIPDLVKFFSTVGQVKMDRMTKTPRVWLYHDKVTSEPTGECTVTYMDSQTQASALRTYGGVLFNGHKIKVTPSIVRPHMASSPPARGTRRAIGRGRGGRSRVPSRGRTRVRPEMDSGDCRRNLVLDYDHHRTGRNQDQSYDGYDGQGGAPNFERFSEGHNQPQRDSEFYDYDHDHQYRSSHPRRLHYFEAEQGYLEGGQNCYGYSRVGFQSNRYQPYWD